MLKKIMLIIVAIILVISLAVFLFINQSKFGKLPSGERLERIKKSVNYKDGAFHNQTFTPVFADGVTYFDVMKEFFFGKTENAVPVNEIPSIKTNLLNLAPNLDIMVWFGHSSYFIQADGKRFLVDPVFSGSASPLPFSITAFKGSNVYSAADIPQIDYLLITHDHWDHLDYETIIELKQKINRIVCPLGVGEHFEYWGFDKNKIIEEDWNTEILLDGGFVINTVPARHFGGRIFRNKTLWTSYVLKSPKFNFFIGGDGGYDKHFAEIGSKFGQFDLAILENGQYNKFWKNIHLMPDEIMLAAKELKAKRLFPVHNSKFKLALHPWDEPMNLVNKYKVNQEVNVITPMIGELIHLNDTSQQFSEWWKKVK